jgi:predicted aspartyl protease
MFRGQEKHMRPIFRIVPLAASLLLLCPITKAQTTPAAHKGCTIDKSEPTEADIDFYRGYTKKAEALYSAALAKDPNDRHSHELYVDTLISLHKLDEARKASEAWTTSDPNNATAIATAADLRFAEGDWIESYALNLKALQIDPCLASAYVGLADYEDRAGYRATAHKHYALAHQLDPNDQNIRYAWISGLNQSERIKEWRIYLSDSKAIDESKRKSYTAEYEKAVARSDYTCHLASISGPARIPMSPIYGDTVGVDAWGIEIAFNGKKRILQIDTGASGFILTQSAGANLNLPRVEKGKTGGIGSEGSTGTDVVHADTVQIGGLEFKNCTAEILHKTGVLGGGANAATFGGRLDTIDGLVSTDIFNHYLVTLDYINHEIRLDPLPQPPSPSGPTPPLDALGGRTDPDWLIADRYIAPSMESWTKIYREGHLLIVPTRLSSEKKAGLPRLFILDTGASVNTIDLTVAKEITNADENRYEGLEGLSGNVDKVFDTGKFTLDFAGFRLPVTSMAATDLSDQDGLSGLIGYPVLNQLVMHIDYRDNLVSFDAPEAKKKKKK